MSHWLRVLQGKKASSNKKGAIAQVHKAVLKDGTQVAVKVRHPKTAPSVYLDLAILNFGSRMVFLNKNNFLLVFIF